MHFYLWQTPAPPTTETGGKLWLTVDNQQINTLGFRHISATVTNLKVWANRRGKMVEERDRCQPDSFEIIDQPSCHSYLTHCCSCMNPRPCLTTQQCSVSRVTAAVLPAPPLRPQRGKMRESAPTSLPLNSPAVGLTGWVRTPGNGPVGSKAANEEVSGTAWGALRQIITCSS